MKHPRVLRSGRKRGVLSAVVVLMGVGTMLVGTAPAAVSAVQPPGLDHFLCYDAATPAGTVGFPNVPPQVRLKNQFGSAFFPAKPNPVPNLHCNPVQKTVPNSAGGTTTYPVTNPQAHSLCFPLTTAAQGPRKVLVRNQFGKAQLRVGEPNELCLPTWKNVPPPPPSVQPPGLDHFTCYPVNYLATTPTKFTPPAAVQVKDQFVPAAAPPVPVTVGDPKLLCVPTNKKIPGATFPPQNPRAHLLCFKVTKTPLVPTVQDQNQFGASPVNITKTRFLCLPSFKKIIP